MKKLIGYIGLKILGWKTEVAVNDKIRRCVLVVAPHTSNLDFVIAIFTFWYLELPWKFFIKNYYTKPFLIGNIFKWLGAIGVERNDKKKKINMVDYAVSLFDKEKELTLLVTAEGSRSRVEKWKMGFYHIAKKANVPVILAFGDYKRKVAGIGKQVKLTDDIAKDMKLIENFYKNITARFPKNYNPKIY